MQLLLADPHPSGPFQKFFKDLDSFQENASYCNTCGMAAKKAPHSLDPNAFVVIKKPSIVKLQVCLNQRDLKRAIRITH